MGLEAEDAKQLEGGEVVEAETTEYGFVKRIRVMTEDGPFDIYQKAGLGVARTD